jgi:hypothetical protein
VLLVNDGEVINCNVIKEEPVSSEAASGLKQEELTLFDYILELGNLHKETDALSGDKFDEFTASARKYLDIICEKLKLDYFQAVMFADIVFLFEGYELSAREIANHIGCNVAKLLKFGDVFTILEDNNLINIVEQSHYSRNALSFTIELETYEALRKGYAPGAGNFENLSIDDFMVALVRLLENCVQNIVSYKRTLKLFKSLTEGNMQLNIIKKLKSYSLCIDDELILLRFCHYLVNNNEESMDIYNMGRLYRQESEFLIKKRQLKAGTHELQKKGLVQNVNEDGLASAEEFSLTDKAKEELLEEYSEQLAKKSMKSVKLASEIPEKKLFYPEKTTKQIDELTNLLSEENFKNIQKNLQQENNRIGFACLFSGGPGTGKTETVFQIARKTGRDIMQVDISNTKSMWFGGSEKKIKEVFTGYKAAVKRSSLAPILLFNEADAVIGKRHNLDGYSGVGQTENAIQNIILQEIENLNGILIATTNLVQNMDTAFERRFLYKIEFEKPTLEARKSIWLSLISDLSESDASVLAEKFNFSGGQIENIARKRSIRKSVFGIVPTLEDMVEFCEDETIMETKDKKIGFI